MCVGGVVGLMVIYFLGYFWWCSWPVWLRVHLCLQWVPNGIYFMKWRLSRLQFILRKHSVTTTPTPWVPACTPETVCGVAFVSKKANEEVTQEPPRRSRLSLITALYPRKSLWLTHSFQNCHHLRSNSQYSVVTGTIHVRKDTLA